MFLVKLTEFEPLLDSTSYLAQYSNDNADIKFAPGKLFLIVPNRSPRFFATLQLSPRWFSNYSVDHVHSSKVSLESFHDAMLDGGDFSSMSIHLLDKTNQMFLRFDTPSSQIQPSHHELTLSPPQSEDIQICEHELDLDKFVIVKSKSLRRVIKELPIFHNDSIICVSVTTSQIKFSIASKAIVLSEEVLFIFLISHNVLVNIVRLKVLEKLKVNSGSIFVLCCFS
ncbi:uncharacterized protein E5676_scaffold46G00830 [Cucumis melo var. makuwa]|uniref:Uncharacterized protein n=1 Tax=Cucumis melo var. makuwa TaxID=1194695 RepID=A0A5D3BV00_CUCMM|nr:uncharacterized protein E5676_scaffold46G00830 [Cucumis melo var. makuwa]